MTDYAQDLTIERRLKAKDKLIAELVKALDDTAQYLGKLAADHDGNFLGRSAKGRLLKNTMLIRKAKA